MQAAQPIQPALPPVQPKPLPLAPSGPTTQTGTPPAPIDGPAPPRQGAIGALSPLPIGAPPPQTAQPMGTALAAPGRILTRMASGNPTNPWMAPETPATPAPSQTPIPLATSGPSGDPGVADPVPYANITKNIPGTASDYTDKTITPGAGVDRLALAKSNFENFALSTDPEFRASLNEANQAGAGAGQIGSGMLRGRLGDIGVTRARDLQTAATQNINDATQGSIADNYANLGIAQQQQGFQQNQQQTAFQQQQQTQLLQEALKNGDFQRYYQLLQAGNAGNPADTQLALSGNYGTQASAAGASAGSLASGAVR